TEAERREHIRTILANIVNSDLRTNEVLIKTWLMLGLDPKILLENVPANLISRNSWSWLYWHSGAFGCRKIEEQARNGLTLLAQENPTGDFTHWEHWLLLFDPRCQRTADRDRARKELQRLSKETSHPYHILFEWFSLLERESTEIPSEEFITAIDSLLGSKDWLTIGGFWHGLALVEFCRVLLDFSEGVGAADVLNEIKDLPWQSNLFSAFIYIQEARMHFSDGRLEEADHAITSAQYYYSQAGACREIVQTHLLRASFWSSHSKPRALEILTELDSSPNYQEANPWCKGYYYALLGNILASKNKIEEAARAYLQSTNFFSKTPDRLKYWRSAIECGFLLLKMRDLDSFKVLVVNFTNEAIPPMLQLRAAYMNALALFMANRADEAILALEGALASAQEVINNPQLPGFYLLLGEIYCDRQALETATEYFRLAMKDFYRVSDPEAGGRTKLAIACLYLLRNMPKEAIQMISDLQLTLGEVEELRIEASWLLIAYVQKSAIEVALLSRAQADFKYLSEKEFSEELTKILEIIIESNSMMASEVVVIEKLGVALNILSKVMQQSDGFEKEWLGEAVLHLIILRLRLGNRMTFVEAVLSEFETIVNVSEYSPGTSKMNFRSVLDRISSNKAVEGDIDILKTMAIHRFFFRILKPLFPLFPMRMVDSISQNADLGVDTS
ncbi:MAG TPA: hypothetical protein VJ044_00530, partial [Candidatus Hodarchaeales archaeon]|nr:hypothetical protein [Candidatus Hodarchaeales archaeon]